ncbi:hypothetical protein Leryth_024875 [Lithospermum erythrorhizon]|nr:hypothetical protein Leryth_024875 [Lithospermum erythrorhizon]
MVMTTMLHDETPTTIGMMEWMKSNCRSEYRGVIVNYNEDNSWSWIYEYFPSFQHGVKASWMP